MHTHTICFPAADPVRYLDEIASSFCDGNGGEEHGDGYLFDCNSLLVEPGSYQEISRDLYINLAGIITPCGVFFRPEVCSRFIDA